MLSFINTRSSYVNGLIPIKIELIYARWECMVHKPLRLPHLCRNCHLSSKNEIFYTIMQVTVIAVQDQDLVLSEIR